MAAPPAPAEALLDFDPSTNDIDARLFENIVEDDYMMHSGKENSSIQSQANFDDSDIGTTNNADQDSSDEQDQSFIQGYKVEGVRGFNTNMDDFLNNFGNFNQSVLANEAANQNQNNNQLF